MQVAESRISTNLIAKAARRGLLAGLCFFVVAAHAQMPGGGSSGGSGGPGAYPGAGKGSKGPSLQEMASKCPPQTGPRAVIDKVNQEIEAVKDALQLTSAQLPLWAKFEDRVRKVTSDMNRALQPRAVTLSQMHALQIIDQALDEPRNHLTGLEDVADSAKPLYQALSPEQQRIADNLIGDLVRQLANSNVEL